MRVVRTTVLAVVLLALAVPAAVAQETRTVNVRGDASIEVPNDTATATVAVSRRAKSSGAALRRSSVRARRVVAALKRTGGNAVSIETLEVDVRRITLRKGDRRIRLFQATNRLRLVTTDVSRTGELLAEAVDAGATGLSGVRFARSDVRQLYRDQLVAAFEDARAKAEALAAEAGLTLGRPLAIEESGFRASVFNEQVAAGDASIGPDAAQEPVIPPVRPGKTTVRARVFVVFEAS